MQCVLQRKHRRQHGLRGVKVLARGRGVRGGMARDVGGLAALAPRAEVIAVLQRARAAVHLG